MGLLGVAVFLLVLGLLIFVHELGHFLAAKACGVYCNRFSLGMPPRLFGIKVGETDYCIGALPFGGYVKMAGQEDAPMTEEEREQEYGDIPPERWLNNRPTWQRLLVFAAGPTMNILLAVVLYGIVAAVGAEVPESQVDNRIGAVEPGSAASEAPLFLADKWSQNPDPAATPDAVGWQTGDRIVAIDGGQIDSITDVAMAAVLGKGKVLHVNIERTAPDGAVTRYVSPVEPKAPPGEELPRFGVAPFDTALVGTVDETMPAYRDGIRAGDVITSANGSWIDAGTFVKLVEAIPEGGSFDVEVERDGKSIPLTLHPETVGRMLDILFAPSTAPQGDADGGPPTVVAITPEVSESTGILRRDIILKIGDQPASMASLRAYEKEHPGETAQLTVRHPAILRGLARKESEATVSFPISKVRAIGVGFATKTVFVRMPLAQVPGEAFREARRDVGRVLKTLAMLVTGRVSPSNLGGPMMIYQATTQAAEAGLWWLLRITAFISANLGVFNLLPLPVLDGGQIVLLGIERARRKPVPIAFVERFQQVGLVLIVGLMLYVTYNDILRWVRGLMP